VTPGGSGTGPGIPVIDVAPLVDRRSDRHRVAAEIGAACRESGFFYVVGHGVDAALQDRLERLSREFFALDVGIKQEIGMARGGPAWRGYFPVGGELTSGRPDVKEGLYFGIELPPDDPRVLDGLALHGPNLMPAQPVGLGETVLAYMDAMTDLGHALMRGIALSLGLVECYFAQRYTTDPLTLFRIFNYPATPAPDGAEERWGVGEHTDYGLLTILRQDANAGLQVRHRDRGWIAAPPVPASFVCNIGDMLDRLTGGHYRSTPHRVVASAAHDRMSWPFFFDPSWDADVRPVGEGALAGAAGTDDEDAPGRWDGADPAQFAGTYGQYLLAKVGKVFPELRREVL
jgi:isopenicillin N synthase-like dioxygenase